MAKDAERLDASGTGVRAGWTAVLVVLAVLVTPAPAKGGRSVADPFASRRSAVEPLPLPLARPGHRAVEVAPAARPGRAEPSSPPARPDRLDPPPRPSAVAVSAAAADPPAPVRPVVVLYGDSLAWEAQDAFAAAVRTGLADLDAHVVLRTFGGTAICDWLDRIADDAVALRPGVVVVEFSGNALTPCMRDGAGEPLAGDAHLDRYAADAAAVIDIVSGVGARLVFAGAPCRGHPRGPASSRGVASMRSTGSSRPLGPT